MSDDELKREAVQAADSICRHAGIETMDADVEDILAALRRVRDAERQRCDQRIAELEQRIAGLRSMIDNGNAVPVIRFNADNDWILTKRAERAEASADAAWLAAWDAEWRMQTSALADAEDMAFVVDDWGAILDRIVAQDALLRRAEEQLEWVAQANCGHERMAEAAATLAAIREQREVQP